MKFLTSSLIDPLRDPKRLKIILAGMLGIFGACLLGLTLSYSIAGWSLQENLTYQMARLFLMGMVGISISFWLIGKKYGRAYLLIAQGLGMALFILFPESALSSAIAQMLVSSPFWATYNVGFARNQSLKNNARELALAQVLALVAGSGGVWMGGLVLHLDSRTVGIIAGVLMVIIATQVMYRHEKTENHVWNAFPVMMKKKPSSRMTALTGALSVFQDSCLPVWFRHVGMSPLSTGTMLALQPILSFIFTPLVGHLVQKGTLRAVRIGGVFILVGWLLIFLSLSNPWLLAPTLGLMQVGFNLVEASEATRWLKMKTAAAITARENLLALGRVSTFVVALPMVFFIPYLYPLAAMGASVLCLFGIASSRRKAQFGKRG